MEENGFTQARQSLDEIEALLGYMGRLAARAASEDCGNAERALLQRDLDGLREQIEKKADIYQNSAVSAIAEQLLRLRSIMETQGEAPQRRKTEFEGFPFFYK